MLCFTLEVVGYYLVHMKKMTNIFMGKHDFN